ncbi:MAG: glycosyl hydrolase 53 family protein [Ekhidna sp.]|nr:glycosyl hydrolase 53 family protein [Ekhidna sp.]
MGIKIRLFVSVLSLTSIAVSAQEFYLGADLSYVNEMNDCGGVYYDKGEEKDVYEIFSSYGTNLIRYRLWHDPDSTDGYSFFEDVKRGIRRAKAQNLSVLLDFHYSDIWADPGRQWRPEAWNEISDDNILGDSVYNYTYNTLHRLNQEGLLPEMVQIGNETNGNILQRVTTDDLREESPNNYPVDWERQVFLLNKGISAVNDFNASHEETDVKTILHIAQPENVIWWMDDAHANGILEFDIIGLSYYPKYSEYTLREVGNAIDQYKERYSKDVLIVEVAYPWQGTTNLLLTHTPHHSPESQYEFLTELTYLVKQGGGMGVVYWEPAWIDTDCETLWGTGSSVVWELLFDESNNTHKGIEFYNYDYRIEPKGLTSQEVTFKVDMMAVDTKKGVYVTGNFTGQNWELISMTIDEDNVYKHTTTILGRTIGGYAFYNDDTWSDSSKEIVPENCALSENNYRKYWIRNESKELYFSWGRCDQIPNELILNAFIEEDLKIHPTIATDEVTLNGQDKITDLQIFNLTGISFPVKWNGLKTLDVSHLQSGTYLIRIDRMEESYTTKFIKK